MHIELVTKIRGLHGEMQKVDEFVWFKPVKAWAEEPVIYAPSEFPM